MKFLIFFFALTVTARAADVYLGHGENFSAGSTTIYCGSTNEEPTPPAPTERYLINSYCECRERRSDGYTLYKIYRYSDGSSDETKIQWFASFSVRCENAVTTHSACNQ